MSTKTKIILIAVTVVAVLIGLIARNKVVMNAPSKSSSMTTAISVSVAGAARQSIDNRISAIGTVNAYNDVTVLSETQGRVVKVSVEVGDYKQAGSVLVQVDSELKEAAFKAAQVSWEKAKKDLERYEALFKEHSISDTQIEQARWTYQSADAQYVAARRQLSDTKITTPISGTVTARFVNIGTMVMGAPQASQIVNIVDISRLKVKVNIAEKDVFKLHVGDPVDVTTDVFPAAVFAGAVFSVSSKGDDGHTYPIEVLLNNPKQQLKAGMFVNVTMKPKGETTALLIPRAAIIGSLRDPKIFVVKDNVARLRTVVAGRGIGTSLEITNGLQEGELVVTDGQNSLSDNVPVVIRK